MNQTGYHNSWLYLKKVHTKFQFNQCSSFRERVERADASNCAKLNLIEIECFDFTINTRNVPIYSVVHRQLLRCLWRINVARCCKCIHIEIQTDSQVEILSATLTNSPLTNVRSKSDRKHFWTLFKNRKGKIIGFQIFKTRMIWIIQTIILILHVIAFRPQRLVA